MSEPASSRTLSTHPPTVASRERGKNWTAEEKEYQRLKRNDATAVSKARKALKNTSEYHDADGEEKKDMIVRCEEIVEESRRQKGLHADVYEAAWQRREKTAAAEEKAREDAMYERTAGSSDTAIAHQNSQSPDAGPFDKFVRPVHETVEQRILHHTGLEDIKETGEFEDPVGYMEGFRKEFGHQGNAKDRQIPLPAEFLQELPDDIVEYNDEGVEQVHSAEADANEDEGEDDSSLDESESQSENNDDDNEMEDAK